MLDILARRGPSAFRVFCDALYKIPGQRHLVNTLRANTSDLRITLDGPGLTDAVVGENAQFTVKFGSGQHAFWSDTDKINLIVELQTIANDHILQTQVQQQNNGRFTVSFFPVHSGEYNITIIADGKSMPCSPHILTVRSNVLVNTCVVKPLFEFGREGEKPGEFVRPSRIAINSKGEILVTDRYNHRVQVFNDNGNLLKVFGQVPKSEQLRYPVGIACDVNDNVFIADQHNSCIKIFDASGKFVKKFGSSGSDRGQLNKPLGVTVDDKTGNVIVAEYANNRIQIFSERGQSLHVFGAGTLQGPTACLYHDEQILVSDRLRHAIYIYNQNGKIIRKIGKEGSANGEFRHPGQITVDKTGRLLVCDCENNRIQIFQFDGTFVETFGSEGSGKGEFFGTNGIGVLPNGWIIASDFYNHQMKMFQIIWRQLSAHR